MGFKALDVLAGKVDVLAFANFGTAMRSSSDSRGKGSSSTAVLDYSKQELSLSSDARNEVGPLSWCCVCFGDGGHALQQICAVALRPCHHSNNWQKL